MRSVLLMLLAMPLLLSGLAGLFLGQVAPAQVQAVRELVKQRATRMVQARELPDEQAEWILAMVDQGLAGLQRPWGYGGLMGLGLMAFLAGFSTGGRVRRERKVTGELLAGGSPVQEPLAGPPALSNKELRQVLRSAAGIEAHEGPEAAGELLVSQGLRDEAAELYQRNRRFDLAAQVRHDQGCFDEATRLFREAGKPESAGAILTQLERFEEAARCYLDAGKCSVAGELFERAGSFREAGRCYRAIGFHRHAAQAYLRDGAELDAARSLISAFEDEGGGGKPESGRAQELRALACKAGELLVKHERFDEAESILVRAGAYARAAKVAFQVGAYDRASDLFLRIGRGDLAAKALERARDEVGAARVLGEYLRDQGRDEEAVVHLEKAGEYSSAADLYRKLERTQEAGECYWKAEIFPAAAEMFHAGGCLERAGDAFERCERYEEAAGCYGEAGKRLRQAEMLERAGCCYAAGEVFLQEGDLDGALRVLQRIESGAPEFPRACGLLGRVFEAKGMVSLALQKYEQATGSGSVTRDNVEAFDQLANVYEARGDRPRAIEILERILGFDYHHSDVSERLERLKELERRSTGDLIAQIRRLDSPDDGPGGTGGRTGPRYEVVRELGRGGMGVVYLARDVVLEREVAYKVLPEGLRGNENALRSFLREAKAAAQLNHPNIVTVYDAGESEHGFYLAMEYVDGTTLKAVVQRRGPITPAAASFVMRQMAEALGYAHSRRVMHRDVKTANTMWTSDRQVKIMDFGLAKLMEEVRNATTLVSGTPFYMSPEQTLGKNVDHRTDIYSLGVMMFELATGQLPFRKGNVPYHHVHTPPPDPRQVRPDLPERLSRVILRCLEKDPDQRFQDAGEIIPALQQEPS